MSNSVGVFAVSVICDKNFTSCIYDIGEFLNYASFDYYYFLFKS